MFKESIWGRLLLVGGLLLVMLVLSACYKDAGEDAAPTSNVSRNDLATSIGRTPTLATNPINPTSTLQATPTGDQPDGAPAISPTTGLKPTITPANTQVRPASTFTPRPSETVGTPRPAPVTPGLSDIQPTTLPAPTRDPSGLQATPTDFAANVEENPCLYSVQPNDTLYSIARDHETTSNDLIAANPTLLAAGEFTVLQIGWQLQLPNCGTPTPAPTSEVPGVTSAPDQPAGVPTTHVVQAGETVYSIARQYGVDPQAIIQANNLTNPDRISVGQSLTIPAP